MRFVDEPSLTADEQTVLDLVRKLGPVAVSTLGRRSRLPSLEYRIVLALLESGGYVTLFSYRGREYAVSIDFGQHLNSVVVGRPAMKNPP